MPTNFKIARLVLTAGIAIALTACSGIKTFEFPIHGLADQNPNSEGKPSNVQVRVLQICGQTSAEAFRDAVFSSVWRSPVQSEDVDVVGKSRKVNVRPGTTAEVRLEKVPARVTHIGLLALFENPQAGKDRIVLPKGEVEDADFALRGYTIVDRNADGGAGGQQP
ncbi:MAG: type VI secretion system lipoprotein TssJ [bacterium]|nr:type VI secretion system lipoprotein TssJ [bacterium]